MGDIGGGAAIGGFYIVCWARHGSWAGVQTGGIDLPFILIAGLCESSSPGRASIKLSKLFREHSVRSTRRLSCPDCTGKSPGFLKFSASLGGALAAACSPVRGKLTRGFSFHWFAAPVEDKRNGNSGVSAKFVREQSSREVRAQDRHLSIS